MQTLYWSIYDLVEGHASRDTKGCCNREHDVVERNGVEMSQKDGEQGNGREVHQVDRIGSAAQECEAVCHLDATMLLQQDEPDDNSSGTSSAKHSGNLCIFVTGHSGNESDDANA